MDFVIVYVANWSNKNIVIKFKKE